MTYFIYDGRANIDINSACVIECFQAKDNQAAAKYHARNYKGQDTVLCNLEDDVIY